MWLAYGTTGHVASDGGLFTSSLMARYCTDEEPLFIIHVIGTRAGDGGAATTGDGGTKNAGGSGMTEGNSDGTGSGSNGGRVTMSYCTPQAPFR